MDATLLEGITVSMALDPITGLMIGQAALSLFDNLFGSGKDARDSQGRAQSMAEDQWRDEKLDRGITRERSREQYGRAKEGFENPNVPEDFIDFARVLEQFIPGINTSAVDMEALAPGLIKGAMFNRMQANVNPGIPSSGIGGQLLANTTSQANMSDQMTSEVLGNLLWSFLNKKPGSNTSQSPLTPGMLDAGQGLLGGFYNPYAPGSSPVINTAQPSWPPTMNPL